MKQDDEIKWRHFVISVHEKIAEIQACADGIHKEVCRQGSDCDSAELWKIEAEAYEISRHIQDLTRILAINGKQEDNVERFAFCVNDIAPVSQGSMSVFNRNGKSVLTHQHGRELKNWRTEIYGEAIKAIKEPISGAVSVLLEFRFKRPKNQLTSKGKRTKSYRESPHVKPDLDKLIRAVLDALTGAAFKDDAQVVKIKARKVYSERVGVSIIVQKEN